MCGDDGVRAEPVKMRVNISRLCGIVIGCSLTLWGQVGTKDFKYSPPSSPCSKVRVVDAAGMPVGKHEVQLKKVSIYWSEYHGSKAFEAKPGRVEWKGTTDAQGGVDLAPA